MKRALSIVPVFLLLAAAVAAAPQRFQAKGLVLQVDKPHRSLVISCERISGYMDAMTMPFAVREASLLDGVASGEMVDFTLVVDDSASYIEKIGIHHYEGTEQDPLAAGRLKMLGGLANKASAQELKIGEHVPDFSLTDQTGHSVALSQYAGKVVAITFTYTHCALPNFCFRIANSFRTLQKRFASEMGQDLILMTITFDPVHDRPEVMAQYGVTWNADPKSWVLLTGDPTDIEKLCGRFGISAFADEGLMNHSLHTFVVDREGRLVANLEGNEFTADQLGDLVQTVLRQPKLSSMQSSLKK